MSKSFHVATPLHLHLPQHGVDAEDSGPLQDLRVRDPVLPSQLQYSVEAAEMEMIQLPGLVRVDGPGLRSVKECRKDDGLDHLQFDVQEHTTAIPNGGPQAVEALTGLGDRLSNLVATYGLCIKGTAPLLSSDGIALMTAKSLILTRWTEHFRSILTCSSAISNAAIDRLLQWDTNNDLDLPPSLTETIRAVQQISSSKAPGSDTIQPEVYKNGGSRLIAELTTFFQEMCAKDKFLCISKT
ncbi:unnamed protein product [Schistocephalus solidus]|uniref:Interleukin enhancer-binding factor 3 n=1 Tax=Schistocephalus solidus TaxID=70667 RepID=A0A183SD78_SCHSO|nr:unnamed protein product [Schistocephalus solidus]